MTTLKRAGRCITAAALAAWTAGCLPADTRKAPGSIVTTVESDGVAASGISDVETVDGWGIDFDEVLVNLGDVSLDGDSCDEYSSAGYDRLFDMKVAGKQKVSVIYALGPCDYGFRVTSPDSDTVLGQGITEVDRTMMRTPGSDLFNDQAGISIYVRGRAHLGALTRTFAWPFRLRARYSRCESAGKRGFDLSSGRAESVNLMVHPGALFADSTDLDAAHLRFEPFAEADSLHGDQDGDISLSELGRVRLSDAGFSNGADSGADDAVDLDAGFAHGLQRITNDGPLTLEDYLYLVLFPSMVSYGTGDCSIRLTSRGLGG